MKKSGLQLFGLMIFLTLVLGFNFINAAECSSCGAGLFNICTSYKCADISLINNEPYSCVFSPGILGTGLFDSCTSLSDAAKIPYTYNNHDIDNIYPDNGGSWGSTRKLFILNSCQELNQSDSVYVLANNLSVMEGNCFNITADNLILDLNNFNIDGNGTSMSGIVANNRDNLIVRNGIIENFRGSQSTCFNCAGLSLDHVSDSTFENIKLYGNFQSGLFIYNGNNNYFNNFVLSDNLGRQVYVISLSNSTMVSFNLGNSPTGFTFFNSQNVTLEASKGQFGESDSSILLDYGSNLTNYQISDSELGLKKEDTSIRFNDNFNMNGANIQELFDKVQMTKSSIEINTTANPEFSGKTAKIIFGGFNNLPAVLSYDCVNSPSTCNASKGTFNIYLDGKEKNSWGSYDDHVSIDNQYGSCPPGSVNMYPPDCNGDGYMDNPLEITVTF